MLDAIISVVQSPRSTLSMAAGSHPIRGQVCAITRGEESIQLLNQLTTQIERLSDTILYAPNLNAVIDVGRTQQQCLNDLREVRAILEPIQRAIGSNILSSAVILMPEKMQHALNYNPWEILMDIRPVSLFSAQVPMEGIPILFEHQGIRYLGWQMRGVLPILFNCRYDELWLSASGRQSRDILPIFSDCHHDKLWLPPSVRNDIVPPIDSKTKFMFETVTIDKQGQISERLLGQAWMQVEDLGYGITLEMVYIAGGTFLMGAPLDEIDSTDSERPQHSVTVTPFYIGKYPITQAQWQIVMGNNPSHFEGADRPVEQISWHDSVNFCQKLSELTGHYYHLPSEEQWEYACRAGTTTPFCYGETITPSLANYDSNRIYAKGPRGKYREETTPVGIFLPNAWGLYDMHGNVWEWCQDVWRNDYSSAHREEDRGLKGVFRGSSWCGFPRWLRSAYRYGCTLGGCYDNVGMRVARTI